MTFLELLPFYASNFMGRILILACASVCVSVRSRYRLATSCMDSSWKKSRHVFFSELSPLVKLWPFANLNEILKVPYLEKY